MADEANRKDENRHKHFDQRDTALVLLAIHDRYSRKRETTLRAMSLAEDRMPTGGKKKQMDGARHHPFHHGDHAHVARCRAQWDLYVKRGREFTQID
ncbi:hypothetical protein [Dyella jiangningensis]